MAALLGESAGVFPSVSRVLWITESVNFPLPRRRLDWASLIQTGKIKDFPLILMGTYWQPLIAFLRDTSCIAARSPPPTRADRRHRLAGEAVARIREAATEEFGLKWQPAKPAADHTVSGAASCKSRFRLYSRKASFLRRSCWPSPRGLTRNGLRQRLEVRAMRKVVLFSSLFVLLLASLALAAGSWELGRYQLVNGPSSGPLQSRLTGRDSLSSYGFVGKVGGVAFAGIAEPGPTLNGKPIRLVYESSRPDGERFAIEIGGKQHFQNLPDWILIPVARYVTSDYNACVSLFGPKTSESHYDIVYHQALRDTLLGLRLLQADILFIDLGEMWNLPRFNGKIVLGKGESEPTTQNREAAIDLQSVLEMASFQSWVLTDVGETIRVNLKGDALEFSGLPYYHFWIADTAGYEREFERLKRQAEKLLAAGDVAGHNRIVQQANNLEPKVQVVSHLTESMKQRRETIRRYNQLVYDAATRTMRYAAFFRYVERHFPASWKAFSTSLPGAAPQPKVETPVRWATTH
jgi:hypothetical protein